VLQAQVVDVRVVESVGGRAAPSAIVALRRADGTLVERRLTDLQGRARFSGMGLGTFLLEADQIGARRATTSAFDIETVSDTVRRRLAMVARPFTLPDVNVASREVACAAGGVDGVDLVAVWEEARKALTATVLTEESVQPLLQRWRWVRVLDRNQRERGKQSNLVEYTRGAPFVSAPPEELRDRGYIVLGDSLDTFYAPDARVLLDEGFLESHCFRLDVEARRAEGLVGLQFAPLAGRKVPEIEGTFWLRRRGDELAEITYRYVKLPREFRGNPEFGGRVAFAPVPGVGWIVREWSLQTPVYGVRPDGGGFSGYSRQTTVTSELAARRRLADEMSIVGWHLEGGTGRSVGEGGLLIPTSPGLRPDGVESVAGQPRLCRSGADVGNGLGAVVVRVEREDSAVVAQKVPVVVVVGDAEVQSVRLANDRQLSVVRPAVQIDGLSSPEGFVAVCGVPVGARVRVHAGGVGAPPVHTEVTEDPVPVRVAYRPVSVRERHPQGQLQRRRTVPGQGTQAGRLSHAIRTARVCRGDGWNTMEATIEAVGAQYYLDVLWPSMERLVAERCEEEYGSRSGPVALLGRVMEAGSDSAREYGRWVATVTWSGDGVEEGTSAEGDRRRVVVPVRENGGFLIRHLPAGLSARLIVEDPFTGPDRGPLLIHLPESGFASVRWPGS